jgi:type II secretory pathway pseudopilin PulG
MHKPRPLSSGDADGAGLMGHRRAFSIVETVIVTATLALLATLIVPKLAAASAEATRASLREQLDTIDKAIAQYRSDHGGRLPTRHAAVPLGEEASHHGWGVLVAQRYLEEAPLNAYTGGLALVEGTEAQAVRALDTSGIGWCYTVLDARRLDVYAAGYDRVADRLAHEQR